MDDAVDIWVLLKGLVQIGLIGDIDFDKVWAFATDQLDAIDGLIRGIVQIVCDNDFVSGLEEGQSGEGANVTGSAAFHGAQVSN